LVRATFPSGDVLAGFIGYAKLFLSFWLLEPFLYNASLHATIRSLSSLASDVYWDIPELSAFVHS
jgi:hypothetical protein